MSYKINPAEYTECFSIPASVVDKHIKLAGATQLKILLIALKNAPIGINPETISEKLSIPLPDVTDALNYWCSSGILLNDSATPASKAVTSHLPKTRKIIRSETVKPSREEILKRSEDDSQIQLLLREAQFRFGRPLRPNEASTLVWLYDDEGVDPSIILTLISFAITENRGTIGFIERTAVNWVNEGVLTVSDAEKKINEYYERKSAWSRVEKAMGISHRQPSPTESKLAHLWIYEYGFDEEIISQAYNICVDSTSKISFKYIKTILEDWHKKGVKTVSDIEKLNASNQPSKTESIAKYDLNAYNEMLDKLPE